MSENAKKVAHEIIRRVRKGEKVSKRKIIKANGYSQTIADKPHKVEKTKDYKSVMDPFVAKMQAERDRLIVALSAKKLSKERYRDMIDGLDKLTKNIQLLTGGKTSNEEVKVTWEK